MEPIRIAVSTKDPGYARALARGLAEQGKHFVIEIVEAEAVLQLLQEEDGVSGSVRYKAAEARKSSLPCWEVLVTDLLPENGLKAIFEPSEVVRVDGGPRPVSQIIGEIMEQVCRLRGISWRAEMQRQTKIVAMYSLYGGCGVTSVAVTVGRMLAGAYGDKVLYLPFTVRDGSRLYREKLYDRGGHTGEFEGQKRAGGGVRELLYRLSNRRPLYMGNFVRSDSYGMDFLQTGEKENCLAALNAEEREQFLLRLLEVTAYDWILVDLGQTAECPETGLQTGIYQCVAEVKSRTDCRCLAMEECPLGKGELQETVSGENEPGKHSRDGKVLLWNHSCRNQRHGNIIHMIHDEESFLINRQMGEEGGSVDIIMSKSFAAGVKKFMEYLLESVPNGVEL